MISKQRFQRIFDVALWIFVGVLFGLHLAATVVALSDHEQRIRTLELKED